MDDSISRQDAIRWVKTECNPYGKPTLDFESGKKVIEHLEQMPSAEPKKGRDCTDFVLWLLDEVMDEENWELNAVANGEVIARKLKKLGLLEVKDGYYIHPSADRPSGEWKYLHGSIGSYMTISCPFCGVTFNNVAEWEYNFCPHCGARMKGADDDD